MRYITPLKRILRNWIEYHFSNSPELFVNWAITGRCNSRCIFCEAHEKLQKSEDLPMEAAMRVIEELVEMEVKTVCFIGGEPLIRKDIWIIIDRLAEKQIRPCLITNGLLLDRLEENQLRLLRRCDSSVTVSLDSANPEQNDAIRGVNSNYERAVSGITKLRNAGINVVLSTVVMKENADQIPALCKLTSQLNVRRIVFQPISHVPFFEGIDAKREKKTLGFTSEQELGRLRVAVDEGIKISKLLNIETNLPLFKLWAIEYFRSRFDINDIRPRFFDKVMSGFACRVVQYRLFLDYDGSVKSCMLLPAVANINQTSVREAWGKLRPLRKKFKKNGLLKICDNCFCNIEDNFIIGAVEHPIRNLRILMAILSGS